MKNPMIAAAVALFCAGAFADTFYVDPTGGTVSSDDYDGPAETWQGGTVGPMKTLAAVAAKAGTVATKSNPCTIIALPGEYKEGVSNPEAIGTAATLNRVTLKSYITLQSRDGREKTFIIGAKSDAPNADANGLGTNAVRCVSGGTVRGFTITGGRTCNTVGGGVNEGTAVDCIITNNAATKGGGNYYGTNIRCFFKDNKATNGGAAMGSASYNCYFGGAQTYQGSYYNCTFASSSYPRSGSCYNCLLLGTGSSNNGSPKFYHCYHIAGYRSDATLDDCVVFSSAASIKVDATGRPTDSTSSIIDKGSTTYFNKMSETAKALDVDGNGRLYNGLVDVGCYEHNPCADFSQVLSPDGAVTVTEVTSYVTSCVDRVSIGANEMLQGTLNLFDASTTMWSFFAEVKGTGALKVYFADAAEPSQTVTATGEPVEVKYTADEATGLKLVYEGGDGVAEVSRFTNVTRVSIAAEGTEGLAITGDITAAGEYMIGVGETKSVTFNRANAGLTYVSGITVNGTFYNLYDYPSGVTFTVSGSERATAIAVETVTAEPKELFVDRVNGSDSNCGLYTNLAFQSLAKAASVATANWTILALPGVYDNEVSNPEKIGTATTLNRVTLPANVTLKAIGTAEETFIMGSKSDAPNADSYGCGTNAVRCVLMNSGSRTWGFTLTGGRTFTGIGGGGASSGTLVDCIVSNNVCSGKGGGASGTAAYRCRFYWNECGSGQTGPGMNTGSAYGCYFKDCNTYQADTYQCTFGSGAWVRANSHYNDLYLYDGGKWINGPSFHNCYFTYTPNTYSTPVLDSECVVTNAAALPVDARGCPAAGSLAIDAGRTDYFEKIAAAYRDVDAFGGQRVYNGAVDVGCGEYDWRGDFAKTLAKKGVAVEVATANVTTNLEAGVDVPAGESLKLKLVLKTDGKVSFKVVAEDGAVAAVTVGGEPVTPGEGGKVEFEALAGETEVEIAVTGEGQATVSDVILPKRGVLLLVR